MYRPHQQPDSPDSPNGSNGDFQPNPAPVHTWYAGYPQPAPLPAPPATYCAPQEEHHHQQMWHHHAAHSHHPVFQHEYPEYIHHTAAIPGLQVQHAPHHHHLHHHHHGEPENQLPSPPITVSGSDMSSPGGQSDHHISPQLNHNNIQNRPPPARSPYEWIKKTSYNSQPNPGKTRTKDKYRVVYTDHQRIELEKEFTFHNKYITIRRKSELAMNLGLSERQIKIWFQNRRAKERKQNKKRVEEKSQMDIVNTGGYAQNIMNPIPQLQNLDLRGQQTVMSNMMSATPASVMQRFMDNGHSMKMENNENDQIG